MLNRSRIFWFLLTGLFVFCSLYYLSRIYLPFVRNSGTPGQARLGGDFYPRWSPIRGLLLEGIDPYSQTADVRNQVWTYGAPLETEGQADPIQFCYPGTLIPLFAPFALMTFGRASAWMLIVLSCGTILAIAMWLRIFHLPTFPFVLGCVFAITSWPFAEGLILEQPTLVVMFLLTAGLYLACNGRFFLAGCLLALSTIKPQIAGPCIAWLLMWSYFRHHSRRLIAGFVTTLVVLLAASEWLFPRWIPEWIAFVNHYVEHSGSRLSLQFIFGSTTGLALTGLIAAFSVFRLLKLRSVGPESASFSHCVALVFALTLLMVPRSSWRSYDEVMIFPAGVFLFMRLRDFKNEQPVIGLAHLSSLLAMLWPAIATCALTGVHLLGARLSTESIVRAPTYAFFVVAPLTMIALLLVDGQAKTSSRVRASEVVAAE